MEPYVYRIPQELEEYKEDHWTDFQELKMPETGLVKQVFARYVSFLQQNYQWIWPILTIALVILYCTTTSAVTIAGARPAENSRKCIYEQLIILGNMCQLK